MKLRKWFKIEPFAMQLHKTYFNNFKQAGIKVKSRK